MDEAFAHLEGNTEKQGKKPYIAPDGGWGYIVCIGVGFTFMLGFGSSNAFGILFNDFFMEQDGASGLPLVIGVYNGALSIAGFLSGIALKKYSFRQVGLVGAGLFVLGDILTIFVQRTYQLVFTFGVIRGAGFGVMIPVSFTAFNCYFTKKRTAMMSANQTMSSMASITFPILVTFLLSEYGFRWTLALVMAIDLHLLFAMIVMHPVEWHMIKVPELTIKELSSFSDVNDIKNKTDTFDEAIIKMLPGEDVIEIKKPSARHESIQKSIIKIIYDNVEIDLLKDPRFVSTLVGLGFAFVSDVTYLAMEPMLLFSYQYSKMQVATCVMAGAIADLAARFFLAIFTYFYTVDSRKLFFVGTCITMILRIDLIFCIGISSIFFLFSLIAGLNYTILTILDIPMQKIKSGIKSKQVTLVTSDNVTFVFTITIISGLVRCSVQVLFPLVLVTAAPDRFPAALALHILFSGCLMLMADPMIGVIYEATGSYVNCFIAMSFCCLVCIVLWTVEFFVYRKQA